MHLVLYLDQLHGLLLALTTEFHWPLKQSNKVLQNNTIRKTSVFADVFFGGFLL
jgi:hypothetical protein